MDNTEIIRRSVTKLQRLQASRPAALEKVERANARLLELVGEREGGRTRRMRDIDAEETACRGAHATLEELDRSITTLRADLLAARALLQDV